MDHEIELKLRWRRTWPEEEEREDYVADAPTYTSLGRIYLVVAQAESINGRWFWSLTAHGNEISRNVGDLTGYEDSAREAAARVERAWFAAIRGSKHEVPAVPAQPRNAYAAAKGRD